MSAVLEVRDLLVRRNGSTVLNVEHMAIQHGQVLTVIGPNGAGKSTLMLCLAHLLRPDKGQLIFQGRPLRPRDGLAYRRRIGLVLQDPLLLDTSVLGNVTAGLRFRRVSKADAARQADFWLDRFGIAHLRDRPARQISGGEAQRASLARAFALNPDVLLLDEPFSALDAPTRARLLADFQALLSETAMTTVFVTHDLDEARLLGDQIAVLLDGRIRQTGSPEEVFSAPADQAVAAFVGVETAVAGKVVASDKGTVTVAVGDQLLEAIGELAPGRSVLFCLRPEDVTLWADDALPASSARNRLSGVVDVTRPKGPLVQVVVDCGFPVSSLITQASAREMSIKSGLRVVVTFKASAVHLIPR